MSYAMAGTKLFNFLRGNLNSGQLLGRLAPDLGFAALNMATTPGGIGEKATAGITDFTMSGLAGLAAGNAARKLGASQDIAGLVDMGASLAGAYAAYPVSNTITRGVDKLTGGPGMTTYEKMAQAQQEELEKQMRAKILQEYGLGTPQSTYLQQLGMG